MRAFVVLAVVVACRLGFDSRAVPDAPVPDAPHDATASPIGCADGTREALVDPVKFPNIAGCAASWPSTDLRRVATGASCGNSLGECSVPADACASGWHMCGTSGEPAELSQRASSADCAGILGAYVLATSHCSSEDGSAAQCAYDTPLPCLSGDIPCAEPACCGNGCNTGNDCKDGFYGDGSTTIAGNDDNGPGNYCADFDSSFVDGVLCCR